MSTKACFVYPWATFGGVERVLLNRAIAFKTLAPDEVEIDVLFLQDSGGLGALKKAIVTYGLENYMRVVNSLEDQRYDLISLIDCPEAFSLCNSHGLSYIIECHTPYAKNRAYLKKLDSRCKGVFAPSRYFADIISNEAPMLTERIYLLRNFVPWDIESEQSDAESLLPKWVRTPVLFFGRMDFLKNPISLLDSFLFLEKSYPRRFMLILCGPQSPEVDIDEELRSRGLNGLAVILPPLNFSVSSRLLRAVANFGGIFVSPSKSESFGLSAAEAIAFGLPVVLSDIEPHQYLVNGIPRFLYPLGDSRTLAERIVWLAEHQQEAQSALEPLRNNLSARAFIEDWAALQNEIIG